MQFDLTKKQFYSIFNESFETENELSEEIPRTCKGVMSIAECENAWHEWLTSELKLALFIYGE